MKQFDIYIFWKNKRLAVYTAVLMMVSYLYFNAIRILQYMESPFFEGDYSMLIDAFLWQAIPGILFIAALLLLVFTRLYQVTLRGIESGWVFRRRMAWDQVHAIEIGKHCAIHPVSGKAKLSIKFPNIDQNRKKASRLYDQIRHAVQCTMPETDEALNMLARNREDALPAIIRILRKRHILLIRTLYMILILRGGYAVYSSIADVLAQPSWIGWTIPVMALSLVVACGINNKRMNVRALEYFIAADGLYQFVFRLNIARTMTGYVQIMTTLLIPVLVMLILLILYQIIMLGKSIEQDNQDSTPKSPTPSDSTPDAAEESM